MTTCFKLVEISGQQVLTPDLNTPISQCAFVVETGADSVLGSLAQLTPDQALELSAAVGLCWAIGWGFRLVIQTMKESISYEKNDD